MEGEGDDDGVIGEIAGEWDALERTRPGGRKDETNAMTVGRIPVEVEKI